MSGTSNKNFAALGLQNAPEVLTPVQLPIHGAFPPWLSGSLYRTGPGTFHVETNNNKTGSFDVSHWFDGIGMNHRFEIRENGTQVWYQSHKSAQGLEQRIADEGKAPYISFAQPPDPCETIFRRFFTFFTTITGPGSEGIRRPDKYNTSVTIAPVLHTTGHTSGKSPQRPSQLVAKTDASNIQIIDADTLKPVEQNRYRDIDPRLSGEIFAAHGCTDHTTGDYFNYSLEFGKQPCYVVFGIRGGLVDPNEQGRVDILAKITEAPAAYLHSCSMTENYFILVVWQADITRRGISIPWHRNVVDALDKNWNENRPTYYFVVDKMKGGVVAKYQSDPYFAFHIINSYEEEDDVILDIATLPTHSMIWDFRLAQMRDPERYNHKNSNMATARRYRLPNVSTPSPRGYGSAQMVLDVPLCKSIELPRVDPRTVHKRYRYAYGISKANQASIISDRLIKLDMEDPQITLDDETAGAKIWIEPDVTPGEPIFVPDPNGKEEDEGVVLSVVLDGKVRRSMLLVLNARDMKEIGRAVMDHPFPFGFHGAFVGPSKM